MEITLLSEGQAGISRAKVIKLDVQKRERLYFQALQLSLKVRAGERHRGLGLCLPCCWASTQDCVSVGERWGEAHGKGSAPTICHIAGSQCLANRNDLHMLLLGRRSQLLMV